MDREMKRHYTLLVDFLGKILGPDYEVALHELLVDLCRREGSIRQELITAEVVEELVTLHRGMLFEWRIYEGGFPLAQRGRRMAEHLLEGMRG